VNLATGSGIEMIFTGKLAGFPPSRGNMKVNVPNCL
jgi:hypothetical protein